MRARSPTPALAGSGMSTPTSEVLDLATLEGGAFDRLWQDRIEPMLRSHEQVRLAGVSKFRNGMVASAAVAAAVAAGAWGVWNDTDAAAIGGMMMGLGGYALSRRPLDKAGAQAQAALIGEIAGSVGVSYQSAGFSAPAFDRMRQLELFSGFDRSRFTDLFHGTRYGCSYDIFEAHLERETRDKDGDTDTTTVFHGQLIRIAFPKPFLGVTVVRRDAGVFNGMRGGMRGALNTLGLGQVGAVHPKLERVGLADPKFERLFEVYASDQVEARYLVHPVFIERLLEVETTCGGQRVRCAFQGGDLLVAVESGDRFKLGGLFSTFLSPERARLIIEDLRAVTRLIDAVLTAEKAPLVGRTGATSGG